VSSKVNKHKKTIQDTGEPSALRYVVSLVAWPFLFMAALFFTNLGMKTDYPVTCFNLVYLSFAFCIYLLERAMPHEKKWQEDDKQTFVNLAHTALSKGMVQVMVVVATVVGIAGLVQPEAGEAGRLWPHQWPMIAQALLALIIAEFGLYWAHRLAHEVPFLWRFHAVHHSVTRLWFINTGRFHFIDSIWSIILGMPLLFLLGAPQEVFLWVSAVTAFIGMLTHCNIEMRFGPLNYIFNTPGLHRWHHSKDIREGNKNYGENFMIWDMAFGTFFNPDRRPPIDIGIDGHMPSGFVEQLAYPFKPEKEQNASPERADKNT
jgi:sterol desaturase/sphingolipid hydroxylase (fatty acid hydroxylase superfamily)